MSVLSYRVISGVLVLEILIIFNWWSCLVFYQECLIVCSYLFTTLGVLFSVHFGVLYVPFGVLYVPFGVLYFLFGVLYSLFKFNQIWYICLVFLLEYLSLCSHLSTLDVLSVILGVVKFIFLHLYNLDVLFFVFLLEYWNIYSNLSTIDELIQSLFFKYLNFCYHFI